MFLSQLRDIKEITEKTTPFVKYRMLDQENIFPTLFISSLEHLIINKCYNIAFEVFFGVLLQISETQDIQLLKEHRKAIALFTCALQSKKLSEFRQLQEKKSFYRVINGLSEGIEFEDCLKTLQTTRDLLKNVRIDVKIYHEIPEIYESNLEEYSTDLVVLNLNKEYYLLYKIIDYMDEEAIRKSEEEIKEKLENDERFRIEEENIKKDQLEQRRIREVELMKREEMISLSLLRLELENKKKGEKIMKFEELYMIKHKKIEDKSRDQENYLMITEENLSKRILRKESKININEEALMFSDEKITKKFNTEQENKRRKEYAMMNNEEKYHRIFVMHENQHTEYEQLLMTNQEKYNKFLSTQHAINELREQTSLKFEENFNNTYISKESTQLKYNTRLMQFEDTWQKEILALESQNMLEEMKSIDCSPISLDISSSFEEGSQFSRDSLVLELEILASLKLICGSYLCSNCCIIPKDSSLFLRCSICCEKAFAKILPKAHTGERKSVPPNSICVSCNKSGVSGEIVRCICCFIRSEFLKEYSVTDCKGCCDFESNRWVDIYGGKAYKLMPCGFCDKHVNYLYLFEVCTTCHDQICLVCLRKTPFIAISVCSQCHSRREVNPIKNKMNKNFK